MDAEIQLTEWIYVKQCTKCHTIFENTRDREDCCVWGGCNGQAQVIDKYKK